jgi:tRNA(adenine34) deaminase
MSDGDVSFMREALAQAERGLAANEMPIGAVTVLDGEIISAAHWRYSADALLDHADVVALRAAERDPRLEAGRRRDVTLYVTMEPCLMCMGAAMSFRVGRIVYSLEAPLDGAGDVVDVWRPRLGHPPRGYQVYAIPEIVGGVCRDESLALMRTYVERNPDLPWAEATLPGFHYAQPAG